MLTLAAGNTLRGVASAASQLTYTVFGMELSGSPPNLLEDYKVLAQSQLPSSVGTLYTVPTSTQGFIKTILIVNHDTVTRTFRLFVNGTADSNAITPTCSLLPGGCASYEDGFGWRFYNNAGQMLMGTGALPLGGFPNYGVSGSVAESFPRHLCTETNATIPSASGTLWMQAIYLFAGTVVNNILWSSATTAAGTPTNNIFGLYNKDLTLLAQTANQGTAAWAANTLKTIALTSPYTITTSDLYYIGMFMTATTIITSKGFTARTASQLAGVAPILQGTSTTGLTTALPATAAAITVSTASAWCAVS